ncbi:MAG: tyrosine-type recombinase/integrase, partial [Phycisphaeraceae bacterium]
MATAFRRKTATGRTATFYVKWRDTYNGTSPRWPTGCKRKDAAEAYGKRLEALAEKRRAGEPIGPELAQWINTLDEKATARLVRLGLVDAQRSAADRPLAEMLDEYKAHRLARGRNARDTEQTATRLHRLHDAAKVTRPRDLTLARIEQALAEITTTPATFNAYARNVHAFGSWLVKRGALHANPADGLEKHATEDKQHRRALTEDEARRLIEAAQTGDTVTGYTKRGAGLIRHKQQPPPEEIAWSITGPERATLYRFALETALRASTIRGLTVGDFDLAGDEPSVTIRGATGSKERSRRTLPLMNDTAARLRDRFAAKLPTAPALNVPPRDRLADLLRDDLAAARAAWIAKAPTPEERHKRAESDFLAAEDSEGRRVDFHALRDTAATWLAKRGVPLTVVMAVTGHKNVSTLERHYLR